MDAPVTRAEYEEYKRTVEGEFNRTGDENKRQNKRLDNLEHITSQIAALTTSVEKLAVSVESMAKAQEKQGKRLETLESRDGDMWRKAVSYAVTAVIGIVLGFIFTQFGM